MDVTAELSPPKRPGPGLDGEGMNEVRLIQVNTGDCFMPGIHALTAHTSSGESAHLK